MQNYYDHPNKNIPNVVESHVESLIIYVSAILFPTEFIQDPQKAYNRILVSDVNAGSNVNLGDAIEWFRSMSDYFPFVAYAPLGFQLPNDYGNIASTAIGLIYIEELNAYVRAYPTTLEVQFVAFFSDSLDHRRAMTLLGAESSKLTRLYTPMLIDNVEVEFPITLTFQFDKGDLTSEFETYLSQGRIWNIPFTITVRYYEYIFDELLLPGDSSVYDNTTVIRKPPVVSKVDDIIIRLYNQITSNRQESILVKEFSPVETPTIVSTSPSKDSINVPLNSEISIQFSKSIQPSTVSSIKIEPYTESEFYFNTSETTVNFDPVSASGLETNTTYKVTVPLEVKDRDGLSLESEYVFSFKTV